MNEKDFGSHTSVEGETFSFPISLRQYEQLCYLARTEMSVKEIARKIGESPAVVGPFLKGLRQANAIADHNREKKNLRINNEIQRAFSPPPVNRHPAHRRASAAIDWDQISSYAPGMIGGVAVSPATP